MKNLINFMTLLCLVTTVGCGQKEEEQAVESSNSGESVNVDLALSGHNDSVALNMLSTLFINQAHAAVSSLRVCFKRLRFKKLNEVEGEDDNIDLELGAVYIDAAGSALDTISIPADTYRRIEIDLEPDCGMEKSVELVNDFGSFESDDTITIKFEAEFTVEEGSLITLDTQLIIDTLDAYNGTDRLSDVLEDLSYDLEVSESSDDEESEEESEQV